VPNLVPAVVRGALWTRLLSLVLSLAVLLLAVAPALATSIATDLWVYASGDTVNVSGDGFAPSENVEIVTTDPNGVVVDDGTALSDIDGNLAYSFVLAADVPGIYDVVATGLSSGSTASTQFDPIGATTTFPVNGAAYNASNWNAGCGTAPGDICGTAVGSNLMGGGTRPVSKVEVSVQRVSDSTYWNGMNAWVSGEQRIIATGTASWSQAFNTSKFPADGDYKVRAYAFDSATPAGSNCTGGCIVTFTYDGTAPVSAVTAVDPFAGPGGSTSKLQASGTASDATSGLASSNVLIELRSGTSSGAVIASATVNVSSGTWSYTNNSPPQTGTYCVTSTATDNAGNVQSPPASFPCYTVGTPANTAPTGADNTITINEDTSHTFAAADFGFSDIDAGDSLSAVRIDSQTLPAGATLKLSGTTVVNGDVILTASIPNLVFSPAANANGNGYASFTFSVRDSASAYDLVPNTITINVTPVNDAPTVSFMAPFVSAAFEGDTKTFSFAVGDPDASDTFTVVGLPDCGTGGEYVALSLTTTASGGTFQCKFPDGPASPDVQIQVTDSDDADSNIASQPVTVDNVEPTVAISGASNVNEGSLYSLTLGAVTDPGTDTVSSYIVHWGDSSSSTYSSGGVKTHTYADGPNSYNITVDIQDEDSAPGYFLDNANGLSVIVDNVKPTPHIDSLTGAGGTACISGNTVTLGLSWIDPAGAADTYRYDVDWGDSLHSTGTNVFPPVSGLTHLYGAGSYTITITVNDEDPGNGGSVSSSLISLFYANSGILQPINLTGTRSSFKIGSTIPVKLHLSDCNGLSVTNAVLTVHLERLDTSALPVSELVSSSAADDGTLMRYDASGQLYIFNMSTKRSQFAGDQDLTSGSYRVWITGSTVGTVEAFFDAKK
jgi:hypothetical protein